MIQVNNLTFYESEQGGYYFNLMLPNNVEFELPVHSTHKLTELLLSNQTDLSDGAFQLNSIWSKWNKKLHHILLKNFISVTEYSHFKNDPTVSFTKVFGDAYVFGHNKIIDKIHLEDVLILAYVNQLVDVIFVSDMFYKSAKEVMMHKASIK